jgi:DNA-binding MarR family transcriptional regulator
LIARQPEVILALRKSKEVKFDEVRDRFGFLLRRAYQVMRASLENDPANTLGLTSTQHSVLTIAGGNEGLDQIGIARLLDLDRTTTGLAIKNLEKNGLVSRVRDKKDRRSLIIKLTAKARKKIPSIQDWALGAHTRNSSKLTRAEQKTLRRLLKKLAE